MDHSDGLVLHTLLTCRSRSVFDGIWRRAIGRFVDLELTFELCDFGEGELTGEACENGAVGDGDHLAGHKVDCPLAGLLDKVGRSLPAGVIRFGTDKFATKHSRDILVVELNEIEALGAI